MNRRSPIVALLVPIVLACGCDGGFQPFEKSIFAKPVTAQGVGGNLPSIEEQAVAFEYPTFKNSDGSVTRVVWLEVGMGENIATALKDHPDYKKVKANVTKEFFTDPNINEKDDWKKATGSEALLLVGTIEAVEKATDLVGWLLRSRAQIAIESRVVEVQETDEFGYGIDWFLLDRGAHGFDPNDPLAPLDPTKTVFDRALVGRGVPPLPGFGGGGFVPNLIAQLGVIQDDIQVDLLIQALKVFTKVDVVNSPNIAVLDGQSATITSGQEVPFFTPQITGGNPVITTSFKPVSVRLQVIPRFIPPDTIRLIVKTEVQNVIDVSTVTFEGTSITNPVIATRSATTTIDVPDGSTVVLGGLITNSKIEVEEKVPILGDIPILSVLFRSKHMADSRNNLIFFIRPKLITPGSSPVGEVILPPQPGEMAPPKEPGKDRKKE